MAGGQPWGLAPDDGSGAGRPRVASAVDSDLPQARATRSAGSASPFPPFPSFGHGESTEQSGAPDDERPGIPGVSQVLDAYERLTQAKPLSATEAKAARDDLIQAYKAYADYADWTITNTNRAHVEAVIWSTIQDDEYGTLADFAIEIGRSNPLVAQAVRGMVRTARLAKVGAIMGPRFGATLHHYAVNGGFGIWAPAWTQWGQPAQQPTPATP